MTNQWLRSLFIMMCAGSAMAGCASSGSQTESTKPAVDPMEANSTQAPPPALDASGYPNVPGTRRTFYFDYDRAVINPDDLSVLEMHATYLRDNPGRTVVVEGHCDERGTRDYNLALGERRSDVVRSFLTSAGVSPRQIDAVSYGEERVEDSGHNESAWSRSRRAEMIYR